MFLIQLHPRVPSQIKRVQGNPLRKIAQEAQKRAFETINPKIKFESRKLALAGELSASAKQKNKVPSLVRIQIEEIKRKVRVQSPAALQFIGPGDH